MALVLPSALPLPLLSTILDSLFTNFQSPTISLLSAPVLTTIAAGIRSGLVVDIGWAETVITGVYEYREVQCARSVRASKLLGEEMFKMLAEAVDPYASREDSVQTRLGERMRQLISFEVCEEVTARMAWCRSAKKREPKVSVQGLTPVKEEDEFRSSMRSLKISGEAEIDPVVSIPLNSTTPPKTLRLPFSKLADPCESALFAPGRSAHDLDDEELPLHLLVYRSLLQLPVDVRSICMSRIVFVGGGSKLLGLKGRILDEVAALIDERGWDPVQGKAVETLHDNPKLQRIRNRQAGIGPTEILREDNPSIPTTTSAAVVDQEPDPIEEQLKREASKGIKPIEHGHLRAVKSLGAWSGGSLLSQLKIPAVSIIDREQWLQYGATGASRTMEVNIATQRQSMGPSSFKPGAGERSSWTLGLWG
jgi:actin-related protein